MSRHKYLWLGILCSLLVAGLTVSCASEDKLQTESESAPPSTSDAERALTAVQARAPFPPCFGKITHRVVSASRYPDAKFDLVFSSCLIEGAVANAGWSASNNTLDPDEWYVSFGGFRQSQISHLRGDSARDSTPEKEGSVD